MKNQHTDAQPSPLSEHDFRAWLEEKVEQLHTETRVLVDDYWRRLNAEQKNQPNSGRGRIGVRVRRREANLSFSIEWFRMAMIRQGGKSKPIAKYLKKGRGHHYPLAGFLNGEPEWEADLVTELETEFADIRKQLVLLGKLRMALQAYHKAVAK